MSHKLEGILTLARTYQLPLWLYSPHPELNPYLLASLGFRPIARNLLQCYICSKEIAITQQIEQNPKEMLELIRSHEQNCIYINEQPSLISREQLYLSMDEITNEMDLSKHSSEFPLLNREEILKFIGSNTFLFKKVLNLYEMSYSHLKITFILKMFGWYLHKNEQEKPCISCYFCGRTTLLGKYATVREDQHNPELQKQTSEELLFNPIIEHRYFCFMANQQQNWLIYLQHQEDKFSETCSFKFKTAPIETQRMRLHIDKYIETAKEKIQNGLLKLKVLTHQSGLLCAHLGEDKNLGVSPEQQENQLKRFREHQQSLLLITQHLSKELNHPLKKIKLT